MEGLSTITSCVIILLSISVQMIHFTAEAKTPLSPYIRHYEPLSYDTSALHDSHLRTKRSLFNPSQASDEGTVTLMVQAYGRDMELLLQPDTSLVSDDVEIEHADGTHTPADLSHMYSGYCKGYQNSRVFGSIVQGVFSGYIRLPDEKFYVERAKIYLKDPSFPSVIFSEKDMDLDPDLSDKNNMGMMGGAQMPCGGSMHDITNAMRSIQFGAERQVRSTRNRRNAESHLSSSYAGNMYMPYSQRAHSDMEGGDRLSRKRRDTNDKRTCSMQLQSDTTMWDWMIDDLGLEASVARDEISGRMLRAVEGATEIFEGTRFTHEPTGTDYTGFNFVVHRLKVLETDQTCPEGADSNLDICKANIGVLKYLELVSLGDSDEYCLSYTFAYRDFSGGTLGLAWVGYPNNTNGGVCEQAGNVLLGGKTLQRTLNSGIVSLLNHGQTVAEKITTLTLTHEIGHNFGALHDPDNPDCSPGSQRPPSPDGNYIMFASATSGSEVNNYKFSSCSKRSIAAVLHAIVDGGKHNCFIARESAYCGNMKAEEDEQCDCGWEDDCKDTCCRARQEDGSGCTLTTQDTCSPTAANSSCCSPNCSVFSEAEAITCATETECRNASLCDGMNAVCPPPENKPEDTLCNSNSQICRGGLCNASFCELVNWEQCYVESPEDSNNRDYDREALCYVACKNPDTETCVSTGNTDELNKAENAALKSVLTEHRLTSIKLPPASACDNYRGYCDVLNRCRPVEEDGPLSRLINTLFGEETLNDVRNWIVKYWWAVLLMGIGLLVLMILFVRVCAVHTPSSNPKKPPPKKFSETLRRQSRHKRPGAGSPPAAGSRAARSQQYEMDSQNKRY